MTKTELIDAIAAGVDGLTKAKAEQALNVTLGAIMDAVAKGETLSLIGFGTFSKGERGERMARHQSGRPRDDPAQPQHPAHLDGAPRLAGTPAR